jgi:hypothetical protein
MDKAVALCLACYGAGDSDIAPSNATLVEHVGCSESTIGRSLSNLAKCGWIHFEKNTSKYIRSPRRIILDWAIAKDQETKETLVEPGKPRVVWREEEEVVTGDYQGPKKHGF